MKRIVLGLALAASIAVPAGARAAPSGMEFVPLQSVNTGLGQCNVVAVSGNLIAIPVDESYQQQDLDGDHLFTHAVLAVYDVAKQKTTNTRIPVLGLLGIEGNLIAVQLQATGTLGIYAMANTGRWSRGITDTGLSVGWAGGGRKAISGGKLVYNSGADLHLFDLVTGTNQVIAQSGDATISGNVVAYSAAAPGTYVATLHTYDVTTGLTVDTGVPGSSPVTDGAGIVFRSGSGLSYYDLQTQQPVDLGFTDVYDFGFQGGKLAMLAREGAFWGDLDGDGGTYEDEQIVVVYDLRSGRLVNTGVPSCCGGDIDGDIIVFDVYEQDSNVNVDLNGDGLDGDCVQAFLSIAGLFP